MLQFTTYELSKEALLKVSGDASASGKAGNHLGSSARCYAVAGIFMELCM